MGGAIAIRRIGLGVGAALLLALGPSAAWAQRCPPIARGSASLVERDGSERLDFVRLRIDRSARRARVWTWGWSIGYGALTAGQLALVPVFDDPGFRADLVVGAASTLAGLLMIVALPLSVMSDQGALHARLGQPVEPGARCRLLGDAEGWLVRDAGDEATGAGWVMHVLNVALNAVAGLVLGLGFDRWLSGLTTFVAGTILGEVTILTQPTDLVGALAEYRAAAFDR